MELADVVKQIQETESEVDRMWTSAREQGLHKLFVRSCFSHDGLPDSNPVRELLIKLREKTTKVPAFPTLAFKHCCQGYTSLTMRHNYGQTLGIQLNITCVLPIITYASPQDGSQIAISLG